MMPLLHRLMQGWLFHNDPSFWKPPQIKALVTGVPKVKRIAAFSESILISEHQYKGT